jgi:fermentation-respiration switch protein FrsA (DUF1100 family)
VLIFDYPGYGRSEGKPSEAGCYAAAHAAYQWLVAEQNIPADQIVIYGESLGGAVGIELASRVPHRALVLARTFASLPDVAQAHFSAPVSSLASQRFDSVSRIERCPRPIFIAQADRDRVIPYHQGERLRDACRGKVELHRLRGLDHNDPLPLEFYTRLRDFLQTEAPLPSR